MNACDPRRARPDGPGRVHRRRLGQRLAAALFAAGLGLAATAPWAACQMPQIEIPLRIVDGRPLAALTLDGVEVSMLVDTGAFHSVLSPSTAERLNLRLRRLPPDVRIQGHTGAFEARRAVVRKVGLVGAELPDVEFVVGGSEVGAGIAGILGRNVLSVADAEYDLARGSVRLSFPRGDCRETNFAHWAGDAPVVVVPLVDRGEPGPPSIAAEVRINGRPAVALFDTGAPATVLTRRTAGQAGIDEREMTPAGRAGGAGTQWVRSWTAVVRSFEIGGEKIAGSRLKIDDVDRDDPGVLLGLDYFLSHRIYVSRLQRRVYITWNGGPVFAGGRAAAVVGDARDAAAPPDVGDADADALARRGAAALAAGDHARALVDLDRACTLAPGVATCFVDRARVRLALGQPRPALADLDEALRLDPALHDARRRRAQTRLRLGERAGAQDDLARLDAELHASAGLRADLAMLHASMGQLAPALRQFELWISSHPRDARLASMLHARCTLRLRHGVDLPLARRDCEAAVERDGDSAPLHDGLGWVRLQLGDAAGAKKAFDDAIAIEANASSLHGRGLAQLRLGEHAGGERDLAAARVMRPGIDDEIRARGVVAAPAAGASAGGP